MKKYGFLVCLLSLLLVFALSGCNAGDYKTATVMAENGDWTGAREMFSALGDYKDAATKVTECDYQIACGYMEDGKYEEAAALFDTLGDYQDSADRITECRYQKADELMKADDFDEAISAFEALGTYKDSADLVSECRYQKALNMLEQADYEGAEKLFTDLGEYKEAAEKIKACRYQHAVSLYDEGKYEEALALFMSVPMYEEADHYCVLCYLKSDQNGFVDIFVTAMNQMYAVSGMNLKLEEEIVPYERDERSFYADSVPDLHEILLTFHCLNAEGSSTGKGQINDISVIGDTYDVNELEQIYAEFLTSAIYAVCVLDDATMLDPSEVSDTIANRFNKILSEFTGKEDYNATESFEYHGYECGCSVIFWPGKDGIYRFIFSITIPELVEAL